MTKYLYLEGAGGISGDMTVAALLDLGADRGRLDAVLESLKLEMCICITKRIIMKRLIMSIITMSTGIWQMFTPLLTAVL